MADVLIVCVREDEPQAKALAEMFEAAGFSIGGAPSSDGALRSSGAGLVVWSQASIRSRPFLDAAQRVINAEKAVVASLIEPPPKSSVGDSPVFDLSRWDGDPNDPSLDPLFFAVDRMVNSARASVGATGPAREAYEPPAPVREPPRPSMRTPPPSPSYTTRPSGADPLGSEAEHWRAIRDSRNPSDFMDYLARYGPEGAFAEVAELRLRQLTQSDVRPAQARAPSRPSAPAPSRPTAPPRAEAPPPRRAEPALPPTRRPEPEPRGPMFERNFDRVETRDPPREGGGAMRAFILIALLGGAALAGGLYFGGGMPDFGGRPAEEIADSTVPSAPPLDEGLEAPADAPDERVAFSDAATPRPQRTQEPPPRREQAPTQTAARNEAAATPTPTTSWETTGGGQGGPVSLSPGSTGGAGTAPSTVVPIPPSAAAPTTEVSAPAVAAPRAGTVTFAQRPTTRRITDLYPNRAAREGVGGRVVLDCGVRPDQSLSCSVASESPPGLGFGRAALDASTSYRANLALSNGQSSNGARTRIAVQFQAPAQ